MGLHEDIQLSFMIAGHTRCLVDGCFGLIKKKYRQSDCDTLEQLQKVVDDSASVNVSQQYKGCASDRPNFQWRDWVKFLDERFKPLRGIRSLHHFRFSNKRPGVVFVKMTGDDDEQEVNLLQPDHPPIRKYVLPPTIPAAGLSDERKRYLFTSIREHVWDPFKDTLCPNPASSCQ